MAQDRESKFLELADVNILLFWILNLCWCNYDCQTRLMLDNVYENEKNPQ